jgi:hypothetical protein
VGLKTALIKTVILVVVAISLLLLFAPDAGAFLMHINEWDCNAIEVEFSENVGQSYVVFAIRDEALTTQYNVIGNRVGGSNVYRSGNWEAIHNVGLSRYFLYTVSFGDGTWSTQVLPYQQATCYNGTLYKDNLPIIYGEGK